MQFLCFCSSPGSAEALVRWCGKIKHLLVAYFLTNISAKHYLNWFMWCRNYIETKLWHFKTLCTPCTQCTEIFYLNSLFTKRWTTYFHVLVILMYAVCLYCSFYCLFVPIFAALFVLNVCLHHTLYTCISIFWLWLIVLMKYELYVSLSFYVI